MATKTPLADVLAKELGFKDAKELKQTLKERHSGPYAENVKGRLAEGQGFGAAFKGGASDKIAEAKEAFSSKGLKKLGKKAYNEFFGGDDIISARMRGLLKKKDTDKLESDKSAFGAAVGPTPDMGEESNNLLHIIAKESMSLHGMARDMNVMRQNIIKLVNLENQGKSKKDEKASVNKADMYFLKEDERESKLENAKNKLKEKVLPSKDNPEKEKKGVLASILEFINGILDAVMNFLKGGFIGSIKALFNPMAILKVIGKVFVIATVLISLFQGITAAFNKWKETGSIKEAIIAGLGAIVDFLSFGLFGEDSVRKLFDGVQQFLDPIINSVAGVVTSIKDWITNNVGIPEIKLGSIKTPDWLGGKTIDFGSIGPYYPFKSNPKSSEPEVSKAPSAGASGTPQVPKVATPTSPPAATENTAQSTEEQPPTPTGEPGSPSQEVNNLFNRQYLEYVASGKHPRPLISPDRAKELLKQMDKDKSESPTAAPSAPSAPAPSPTAESGGGSAPAPSSGGGASAAQTTPTGATATPAAGESATAPSGSELAAKSSEVAEAQRMESAADAGTTVNAPTTNNSVGTKGKGPKSLIADPFNSEFANYYATT
jgi:hypothetical protein